MCHAHVHVHVHVVVHVFVIPSWGTRKRLHGVCVRSVLLSGCESERCCVRPLCAVGLSGSCQAVTLGPDSDGAHLACQTLLSGCQIRAVRLSEKVLSALSGCRALSGAVQGAGVAVRLSDQGSAIPVRSPQCARCTSHVVLSVEAHVEGFKRHT